MTTPTKLTWVDPTTNVDGSAIGSGEITGYEIGIRDTSASGSVAGTYPFSAKAPATTTQELLSAITPVLPTGKPLAAAVRANTAGLDANGNAVNSAWSTEATFTLPVPAPVPSAPTNPSVS